MKYEDGEEKLPILLWLQPFIRGHRKKKRKQNLKDLYKFKNKSENIFAMD